MSAPDDPRRELADLTRALGAEITRRTRRGERHTQAPARSLPDVADAGDVVDAGDRASQAARTPEDVARQAAACGDLDQLRAAVARCEACDLARTRKQTVFADGSGSAGAMFVGEAPGADEDAQGVPFVGRAGRLLTDIITKGMGLARAEVCIANVLKCRPPENRDPTPQEKRTCTPWLDRQIELVDPRVLIPLGRHAAMHLLSMDGSMGSMRNQVHERAGRKLVATYHPAYLLRSPGQKKECWKDIQLAMAEMGLASPKPPAATPASPASPPAEGRVRGTKP